MNAITCMRRLNLYIQLIGFILLMGFTHVVKGSVDSVYIDSISSEIMEHISERDSIQAMRYFFLARKIPTWEEKRDAYLKALDIVGDLDNPELENSISISYAESTYKYGHYIEAIDLYKEAIVKSQKSKSSFLKEFEDDNYNNIGLCYVSMGQYDKGLDYYLKALNLREQQKDSAGMASCYHNIGMIYDYQENYDMALEQYELSAQIKVRLNLKRDLINTYSNMALIYNMNNNFVDAVKYLTQAKSLCEELNMDLTKQLILINLGDVNLKQKRYSASNRFYIQVLKFEEKNHNMVLAAHANNGLGKSLMEQHQYQKSLPYLLKANKWFSKMRSLEDQIQVAENISFCYENLNQYGPSLNFSKQVTLLKDSLNRMKSSQLITEMQTVYKVDQKEKENDMLRTKNELQDLQIQQDNILKKGFIGGLALLFIIVGLLIVAFRIKQKSNQELKDKNTIIEKQKEDIVDSINYAKQIQGSTLIGMNTIRDKLPDTFIFYKPRDIVSGDFYWYALVDNVSYIAAVDCTGHGVPGAFMSMMGNSLLNEIVKVKKITRPADILENLHSRVHEDLQQSNKEENVQNGMDIALCKIDHTNSNIEFSGAMNPLYIVDQEGLNEVRGDFRAIGGQIMSLKKNKVKSFTNHQIHLEKDSWLYIFSDGFINQLGGEKRKKFGSRQFKKLLQEIRAFSYQDQLHRIQAEFNKWKEGYEQMDDILIIGIPLKVND